MTTSSAQAARRWIITLGVAAITVSGAYAGANLAVDQDKKKERQALQQAGPTELIAQLEMYRTRLIGQRNDLEKKLDEISRRKASKQQNGG
ncbi:hypothetical protein BDZ85DRAFT_277075 [Elsinoe ampelina]|uniref:Uncharacterized protein n=1 Tax=Elsinoe ampelina TaxID=302913 RepID=A0A6A6GND0_9PEZI|nr:hypothetical protein BDZ85DRAFT_277075 [Elsinoe ampelina]